jgi:hypothetical protein
VADVNSRKRAPLPRDLDRRLKPDDYRSGAPGRARTFEQEIAESLTSNEIYAPPERRDEMNAGTAVNLRKLQEQLSRKPLDEIALLVHGLAYGEMIELSEAIWRAQPEGSAITLENLPALLHRWSRSRSTAGSDVLGGSEVPPGA